MAGQSLWFQLLVILQLKIPQLQTQMKDFVFLDKKITYEYMALTLKSGWKTQALM